MSLKQKQLYRVFFLIERITDERGIPIAKEDIMDIVTDSSITNLNSDIIEIEPIVVDDYTGYYECKTKVCKANLTSRAECTKEYKEMQQCKTRS